MFEPTAIYAPNPHRYDTMTYNRAGTSGLKLPAVSLGFWHNFGDITPFDQMKSLVFTAFDNGITRRIAQVAVATFPNADGLRGINGNAYRVSQESGTYSLKGAGTGGAGLLSPSTLEASTVDLSSEFTGLITTQRAYSASSKIITTADQMLQELLSIVR